MERLRSFGTGVHLKRNIHNSAEYAVQEPKTSSKMTYFIPEKRKYINYIFIIQTYYSHK